MQIYKAPIQDMVFCLESFGFDAVQALEAYGDFDLETVAALLESAYGMYIVHIYHF